jgi:hypothetical protein
VLNPVTVKDSDRAVIHPDRNLKLEFPLGAAQQSADLGIQVQHFGHMIKLGLGHLISVKWFCH